MVRSRKKAKSRRPAALVKPPTIVPPSLPPQLRPYAGAVATIVRDLGLATGFVLVPIELPAAEIAAALGWYLAAAGRGVEIATTVGGEAFVSLAGDLLDPTKPADRIVVVAPADVPHGQSAPDWLIDGIRQFNMSRDRLAQSLRGPLLWCGPTEFLRATAEHAPDLWSIRELSYVLRPQQEAMASRSATGDMPSFYSPFHVDESPERLYALEHAARTIGDDRAAADLAIRRAMSLFHRSRTGEAEAVARSALESLPDSPSKQGERAGLTGILVDVAARRGELDKALRLLREEILPVAERTGSVETRALAFGRIADILQAQGHLDEAFHIRFTEELPVYEQAGEVHLRTVVLGKVADLLRQKGQFDEAERIFRDEVIPFFERIGDDRSCAVTQSKLAAILFARGQLDEALRIERQIIPVFARLGDERTELLARAGLALTLLVRGAPGDHDEARSLLSAALADAERLQLPEADTIRTIQRKHNLDQKT